VPVWSLSPVVLGASSEPAVGSLATLPVLAAAGAAATVSTMASAQRTETSRSFTDATSLFQCWYRLPPE
jgi:hypothetical protein